LKQRTARGSPKESRQKKEGDACWSRRRPTQEEVGKEPTVPGKRTTRAILLLRSIRKNTDGGGERNSGQKPSSRAERPGGLCFPNVSYHLKNDVLNGIGDREISPGIEPENFVPEFPRGQACRAVPDRGKMSRRGTRQIAGAKIALYDESRFA
jgi:hypothetical protein